MAHLHQVLTLPQDAGVTLKLEKYSYFADIINYFVHVVGAGQLELSEATPATVHELMSRTTQTELRSSFGICNVIRRIVANFSRVTGPLKKKLQKHPPTPFLSFTQNQKDVVANFRTLLTNPPILAIPLSAG